MRLDKFLKVSRIIKRRTVANEACDSDYVKVNGRQAKAGTQVKPGDFIEIAFGSRTLKAEILNTNAGISLLMPVACLCISGYKYACLYFWLLYLKLQNNSKNSTVSTKIST